MKKLLLSLGVICLLLLVSLPKVVGLVVRDSTLSGLYAAFPSDSTRSFALRSSSFKGRWFSSSAEFFADYELPGSGVQTLKFNIEIQHGPVFVTNQGLQFGLAQATIRPIEHLPRLPMIDQLDKEAIQTTINLTADFDQSLQIDALVEPFLLNNETGSIGAQGITANLSVNADYSSELQATVNQLTLSNSETDQQLTLPEMIFTGEVTELTALITPYSATVNIPVVQYKHLSSATLQQVLLQTQVTTNGALKTAALTQQFSIGSVLGDYPVNELSWQLTIEDVAESLLTRYLTVVPELRSLNAANSVADIARINELSEELGLLFLNNPISVQSELGATAYDGEHSMLLDLNWHALPNLRSLMLLNLNEAMTALSVSLDLSLDLDAIRQSPMADLVDGLAQQNQIKIDNDRIVSNISIIDGEIVINGDSIPLEQFF